MWDAVSLLIKCSPIIPLDAISRGVSTSEVIRIWTPNVVETRGWFHSIGHTHYWAGGSWFQDCRTYQKKVIQKNPFNLAQKGNHGKIDEICTMREESRHIHDYPNASHLAITPPRPDDSSLELHTLQVEGLYCWGHRATPLLVM